MTVAGTVAQVDQNLLKLARESAALLPALRERYQAERGKPDSDAGQLEELRKAIHELERAVGRVRFQSHGEKTEDAPTVNRLRKSAGHKYTRKERGPSGHWIYYYKDEHGEYGTPHIRDLHHLAGQADKIRAELTAHGGKYKATMSDAQKAAHEKVYNEIQGRYQKMWQGHDVERHDYDTYVRHGKPLPPERRANYAGKEDDEPEPDEEGEKPTSAAASWNAAKKEHGFANPNTPTARPSTQPNLYQHKNDMPDTTGWSMKQLRELRNAYAQKGFAREQRLVQRQMDELTDQQKREKAKAAAKAKQQADTGEQQSMMFSISRPRLVLRKSHKYISKKKGASGEWVYEYPDEPKPQKSEAATRQEALRAKLGGLKARLTEQRPPEGRTASQGGRDEARARIDADRAATVSAARAGGPQRSISYAEAKRFQRREAYGPLPNAPRLSKPVAEMSREELEDADRELGLYIETAWEVRGQRHEGNDPKVKQAADLKREVNAALNALPPRGPETADEAWARVSGRRTKKSLTISLAKSHKYTSKHKNTKGEWVYDYADSPWKFRAGHYTEGHAIPPELYHGHATGVGHLEVERHGENEYSVRHRVGTGAIPLATHKDASIARDQIRRAVERDMRNHEGDLIAAHQRMVADAVAAGHAVPDEVFKDYPELRPTKRGGSPSERMKELQNAVRMGDTRHRSGVDALGKKLTVGEMRAVRASLIDSGQLLRNLLEDHGAGLDADERESYERTLDRLDYYLKPATPAKRKKPAGDVEQSMMFSQAARGGSGRFTQPGSADHLGAHRKEYHRRKEAGEIKGTRQDWLDHATDGWKGAKETHKIELLREFRHLEADVRGMDEGPELDKANERLASLRTRLARLGHKV